MDTLLTIIIPVYNVEETLCRCVVSIIRQELPSCEVLLIDDGSTDDSGNMADVYAEKEKYIFSYHKKNGGLSDARNYGLALAKGKYVTFVDSDDEVDQKTYVSLLNILLKHPEYDILEFPVLQNPGRTDETLFNPENNIFHNPLDWLSYRGTEHCWVCNKIYKKYLFGGNTLFQKGKKYEDILILPHILNKTHIIATTDKGRYIYHYNDKGIMAKDKADGLTSLLEAQLTLVKSLGIDTTQRRWHRVYINMLTAQIYSYARTGKILLHNQHVALSGYATGKDTVKALLVDMLGVRNTCRLIKKIRKN